MIIIGITGTLGAGKGTIVDYLIKKGFHHFSVRAFIIEEIERRGLTVDRDSMVIVANDLRLQHGSAYMAEALFKRASETGENCIIESIRTVGEIEALRKLGKFFLFAVDAKPDVRYQRVVIRGSETDRISLTTFQENEAREMDSNDPNHQNLRKCIEMADYIFYNDRSIDDLYEQMESVLKNIFSQITKQ